jgi:hypothetical protein
MRMRGMNGGVECEMMRGSARSFSAAILSSVLHT